MAKAEGKTAASLGEIRQRINEIDERLQALISERARFAR